MVYTVKQLSELAGVSIRTLHYYDEIGLLEPSWVGDNGYRYYEDDAVFRLQQILFFRELDLGLSEINEIIDMPDFDMLTALQAHRDGLQAKIRRLKGLINTIESTILSLTGEVEMSTKQLFAGFTEEEEKRYEHEARKLWGNEQVSASYKRWDSYTPQQKDEIKAEGNAIYQDLVSGIEQGQSPTSPQVQQVIAHWHQHLRYFYEPSLERLKGLGQMYNQHPDFSRKFREIHPNLAEFMQEAIEHYCANLDTNS